VNRTHQLKHYLWHLVRATNSGGHGVHSPFLFDFIRNVVMEKHPFYCFESIEKQRDALTGNTTLIELNDFGTGHRHQRRIGEIARVALKPARQAQLLFRICARYQFKNILELGTCLGITTLYLSAVDSTLRCTSVEGSEALSEIARRQLALNGRSNTQIITLNLDTGLLALLEKSGIQDLIFIDANHRYEAVTDYFAHCINFIHDNSIIVIDDPYWSEGMTRAWNEIKLHPRVKASIDLYHMGILFFNPAYANKQYRVFF